LRRSRYLTLFRKLIHSGSVQDQNR